MRCLDTSTRVVTSTSTSPSYAGQVEGHHNTSKQHLQEKFLSPAPCSLVSAAYDYQSFSTGFNTNKRQHKCSKCDQLGHPEQRCLRTAILATFDKHTPSGSQDKLMDRWMQHFVKKSNQ